MKITRKQLRSIIKEATHELDQALQAYDNWKEDQVARDEMDYSIPEEYMMIKWMSSRNRLSGRKYAHLISQIADEYGFNKPDVMRGLKMYGSKVLQRNAAKTLQGYRRRRIVGESLIIETKMLPIIVNPYEDLETMNRVANYALTNDIQGALADEMVNYENLDMDLDEMRGWVGKVGKKPDYFSEDAVVPGNWDLAKVRKFMSDLEAAWMKKRGEAADAKHATEPSKGEREVIGNSLTMDYVTMDDIKRITYQIRRKGGEPSNINLEYRPEGGGVDFGNITADQAKRAGFELQKIADVLNAYGGNQQKKSPRRKRYTPMYD